jgi:hypothetical protein
MEAYYIMIQRYKTVGAEERYKEMRKTEKRSHRKENKTLFEKQIEGLINDNAIL